jgi:hypothetical protein
VRAENDRDIYLVFDCECRRRAHAAHFECAERPGRGCRKMRARHFYRSSAARPPRLPPAPTPFPSPLPLPAHRLPRLPQTWRRTCTR